MEAYDIYRDIAERTGGDIYIGVVGPVRTGKSTFIKKMMEQLVVPNMDDENAKRRVIDELPQSGAGRTIMTTQPKFVPNKAVNIAIDDKASFNIRMVDCVGYLVDGAIGHMENEEPRMVRTPWYDYDIPFEQAAEMGTKKVICEHSTVGVVMTADGSFAEIPRQAYVPAEERVIGELKAMGKPFVVVLNSASPQSESAIELRKNLQEHYGAPVLLMDVMNFTKGDMNTLLADLLYEFPIRQINVNVSKWVCALGRDHWLLSEILERVDSGTKAICAMRDYTALPAAFDGLEFIKDASVSNILLGNGCINLGVSVKEELFYKVLGEECGYEIRDDAHLVSVIKDMVCAKREFARLEGALREAEETGYGIVSPQMDDLKLEEPEVVQQGNKFGVRLKASAPSLHIVRVNVETEVSPIVGTEKQSEELINFMMSEFENDPAAIWSTDLFGKSLNDIVKEGLSGKICGIPEDAREKLRETLERIVNEGDGGMLCILL